MSSQNRIDFPFHIIIIVGIIICCTGTIIVGEEDMSIVSAIITGGIGAVSVVTAAIIGARVSKRNQLERNTDAINRLIDDVGRGDRESLSRQHESISRFVREGFDMIQSRYNKEDETYRAFTQKQVDLKETVEEFVKDYTYNVSQLEIYRAEKESLKDKNEQLLLENSHLKEELNEYKYRLAEKDQKVGELEAHVKALERSQRNNDYSYEDIER